MIIKDEIINFNPHTYATPVNTLNYNNKHFQDYDK